MIYHTGDLIIKFLYLLDQFKSPLSEYVIFYAVMELSQVWQPLLKFVRKETEENFMHFSINIILYPLFVKKFSAFILLQCKFNDLSIQPVL